MFKSSTCVLLFTGLECLCIAMVRSQLSIIEEYDGLIYVGDMFIYYRIYLLIDEKVCKGNITIININYVVTRDIFHALSASKHNK